MWDEITYPSPNFNGAAAWEWINDFTPHFNGHGITYPCWNWSHSTLTKGPTVTCWSSQRHYNDVIMGTMASQITSLTIVYSTFYSGADERKHQSSVSLAFEWGNHRWPVNSPHKWPVTRKMFLFDDVIMCYRCIHLQYANCKTILCHR